MAKEYKARGGDYTTPKEDKDESQKHLSKWTEEEWHTKEGSAHAKQDDGTRKRYLPKKAWEEMTEQEKEETETKKQEGGKEGHQFVQNTPRAKAARKNANDDEDQKYDNDGKEQKEKTKRKTRSSTNKEDGKNDKQEQAQSIGTKEPRKGSKGSRSKSSRSVEQQGKTSGTKDAGKEEEQPGQKRSRTKSNKVEEEEEEGEGEEVTKKKQKSNSGTAKSRSNSTTNTASKQDKTNAPGTPGSSSRLPKKGQTAHWKSTPGWIDGTVVEVLKSAKDVDGKHVKASKDDPRIVLKSNKSGKVAVHKVESVYF